MDKPKSLQQQMFMVMKSLTGQNNILTVPKALIDYTGSFETALFLSQMMYWTDKSSGEYVYKTNEEWKTETHLTRYALEKSRKILGNKGNGKGILKCKVCKLNGTGNTAVHYQLDIEKFTETFFEYIKNLNDPVKKEPQTRMDAGNAENSIPECRKQHTRMLKTAYPNAENSIPSITYTTAEITNIKPEEEEGEFKQIEKINEKDDEVGLAYPKQCIEMALKVGATKLELAVALEKMDSEPDIKSPVAWLQKALENEVINRELASRPKTKLDSKPLSKHHASKQPKTDPSKYDNFYL